MMQEFNQKNSFNIPVLILMFNRSDNVLKVIDSLRTVSPKQIYIACDGGRHPDEMLVVSQARNNVLKSIDWDCEVKTLFREQNLGCRRAVDDAIKWFFSHVERGIVLEDDCVPSVGFFDYCSKMLDYYSNDFSVGSISGRLQTGLEDVLNGHFFSSRFFCWGWASWANRIEKITADSCEFNDIDMKDLKYGNFAEHCFLRGSMGLVKSKQVDSWAYIYDLQFRLRNQYCVLPDRNMIRNIGFERGATHTSRTLKDSVDVYEHTNVKLAKTSKVSPDFDFLKRCVLKEFGGWFKLYLFSLAKETKLFRIFYRKLF